jgi:tetratricopeptide (TPR) repeat protein
VLASVLVEKLLDADCAVEAQTVLTAALKEFAGDVRLRQLQGLLFSRTGRLKEACDVLEAIEITDSAADEETQGILAGVYKRRADVEPERYDEFLRTCNEKYYRGWRQSHESNTYLGINAAATALWLGQSGQVIPLATTIRNLLETRRLGLAKRVSESPRFLNCWDQLSLAESHLLLKDWDKARECYREALDRFRGQAKVMEVARDQAKKDLIALGESGLIGNIFPA